MSEVHLRCLILPKGAALLLLPWPNKDIWPNLDQIFAQTVSLEWEGHIILTWWLQYLLFYKTTFSMSLVNNMSPGAEKAITGEKSLAALTAGVLRRQVGWVIKWLVPVSEEKSRGQRTNDWMWWWWWWWWLTCAREKKIKQPTTIKKVFE